MNKQERMELIGNNIKGSSLHQKPDRGNKVAYAAWKDDGAMFGPVVCKEAFKDDEGNAAATWPGTRAAMVAYEANMSIEKILLDRGITVRRTKVK